MSCGVGCRRGSDPALLWLWRRPVATAPIRPLAWEPPYAAGAALEKAKRQKTEALKEYNNPMSDEEYLEKYQNAYGISSEEEKIEVLKNYHSLLKMTLEEQSELIEALKDVASKIDIIEKALKEDDPSFGALDDLQ